jgi:hypothetical protein
MSTGWLLAIGFLTLALSGPSYAQNIPRDEVRSGYTDEVHEERSLRVVEVIVSPEAPAKQQKLSDRIFDNKVTDEIQRRYRDSFGYTDVEQNINAPNRYSESFYSTGDRVTPEQDVEKKRKFGVFMMRKLTEHHVDNYIKESPTARPIYRAKEAISNMNVSVSESYQFKFGYSVSGNQATVQVKNPYNVINSLSFQMDEQGVGPSSPKETTFNLGYPLTTSITMNTYYKFTQGSWYLVGSRQMTPRLSTYVSTSTYPDHKKDDSHPTVALVGFTYTP